MSDVVAKFTGKDGVEYRVIREEVSEAYCCYEFASCVATGLIEPPQDWVQSIGRANARIVWRTSRNTATSHAIEYCPFCGADILPE